MLIIIKKYYYYYEEEYAVIPLAVEVHREEMWELPGSQLIGGRADVSLTRWPLFTPQNIPGATKSDVFWDVTPCGS
jgi:hypothetical protein